MLVRGPIGKLSHWLTGLGWVVFADPPKKGYFFRIRLGLGSILIEPMISTPLPKGENTTYLER